MSALRFWATWLGIIGFCVAVWLVVIILALSLMSATGYAATPHAGGGRTHCQTVPCLRRAVAWNVRERAHLEREIAAKWSPDVRSAVELASRISGVSFDRLWTISECESRHNPLSVLGQYEGLFQLGRYHRSLPDIVGLNPFDPYVNAMHAALFIARHGEGQWSCRSDGSIHAEG